MKILSVYGSRSRCLTKVTGLSRTKQSFAAEADINNIMRRYATTGVLVDPASALSGRKLIYGDFSNYDFRAHQTHIAAIRQSFDMLPADVRRRFDNDPACLIDWLSDESNKEEAIKLGLRVQDAPVNEPAPAPEVPPAPVPPVSGEPVKSPDPAA